MENTTDFTQAESLTDPAVGTEDTGIIITGMDDELELEEKKALSPEEEKEAQKRDRGFAVFIDSLLIAVSAFLLFIDLTTLEVFDPMRIFGPGAFPILIFVALILLSAWNIVEVCTGRGSSAKLSKHINFRKSGKALRLFVAIVVTIFLMNYIGFVLAMMLFTFVDMFFLEEKKVSKKLALVCTVVLPLCIYFLFHTLNVNLPSPSWMPF